MGHCRLAWYRWWIYWNRKECARIKEAIRKAFIQLWHKRVRRHLDKNASENNQYFSRTWSELAAAIDRDPPNVGRYLVETLLILNYATSLGVEVSELMPSREEWITRVVALLLSISDEEAAPYVRYLLRNPAREEDGALDHCVIASLWPENKAEMARLIQRVAVALDAILKPLYLGAI